MMVCMTDVLDVIEECINCCIIYIVFFFILDLLAESYNLCSPMDPLGNGYSRNNCVASVKFHKNIKIYLGIWHSAMDASFRGLRLGGSRQ